MFREFGRGNVCDDDRSTKYVVELAKSATNHRLAGSDEDAIRVKEVGDGTSFAKELGVRSHVYVVAANQISQSIRGAHRHGGPCDDDGARSYHRSNRGDGSLNIGEVGGAVITLRRWHADEHDRGVTCRRNAAGAESQTTGTNPSLNEILQMGFVKVDDSRCKPSQFFRVRVDARNVVTKIRKPRRRRQADVAGADDGNSLGATQSVVRRGNHDFTSMTNPVGSIENFPST